MTNVFEGITGFISCREKGVHLLDSLTNALKVQGVHVGGWKDLPGEATDHQSAAEEHIRKSTFAIIVMDETAFDNRGKDGICAQLAEVRHIRSRMNNTRSGAPFKVWRVIAQDANGFPQPTQLAGHVDSRDGWLFDHKDTKQINVDEAGDDWRELGGADGSVNYAAVNLFAADVTHWLRGNLETLLPRKQGQVNVEAQERAYLARAMPTWVESIMDGHAQGDAINFRLARAVPLFGRDASGKKQPIADWLFAADVKPVILRGGPGMGKRCALLAAAAALARRRDGRFAEYFKSPAARAYLDDAKVLGEAQFVPLVLEAEHIARFSEGKRISPDHVYAAIAAELFAIPAPDRAQRDAVTARMRSQPYALFVDGLEALHGGSRARDLMSALLQMRVAQNGAALKIVATARAGVAGCDLAEVELQPLTDEQVDQFMQHFAWDQFPAVTEEGERDQALATLRRARDTLRGNAVDVVARGAADEVIGTPLLLNAFCWTTLRRPGGFAERRTVLSGQLLDHIIAGDMHTGRGLVLLAKDVRELLRLLALGASDTTFSVGRAMLAAAAWRGKHPDFNDDDTFQDLLTRLCEQTSLLMEQRASPGLFRFCTTFWSEQLAAEALAGDATLLQLSLAEISAAKVADRSRVFANACALVLNRGGENALARSLDVPLAALSRSEDASLSPHEAGNFVCTAAEALAIAAPRAARDGDPKSKAVADEACDAVASRYRALSARWMLKQRDACLNNLARAARRQSSWDTARTTNALLDKVLGQDRWIDFETALGPVTLAARPVIFAEYDAFLRARAEGELSPQEATRLFDHVGAEVGDVQTEGREDTQDVLALLGARPASPVHYITWYEAVAYCRWLTERLRQVHGEEGLAPNEVARLPTYPECQAVFFALAGKGNYPWGDDAPPEEGDAARANCRSAGIGRATAPGVFAPVIGPRKRPIWDFASNVRVWTTPQAHAMQTWWPQDFTADADAGVFGGSWYGTHMEMMEGAGPWLPSLQTRSRQIGVRLVRARVE